MRHKPRELAKPGLSLVDANHGRIITYQQDVLGIKERIEKVEFPGQVSCDFDKEAECWVLIEHCDDGTDRLIFTTKALSESTIDRLKRADQVRNPGYDPLAEIEQEETRIERERDRRFQERVGEAGERLFLALRRDGVLHAPRVFMSNSGRRMRGVT